MWQTWGRAQLHTGFCWWHLKEHDHLENLDTRGRITKWQTNRMWELCCIIVAQNKDGWKPLVTRRTKFWVPKMRGISWPGETIIFSWRILLHGFIYLFNEPVSWSTKGYPMKPKQSTTIQLSRNMFLSLGEKFPTFRRNVVPSTAGLSSIWRIIFQYPSGQEIQFCRVRQSKKFNLRGLLNPEDEGNTKLRNVGKYSHNDRASHLKRLQS
jgi:hypothetical protein